MKRFLLITVGVVALGAAAVGCGAETPGPQLRLDGGGGKLDGHKWPDFGGPKYDLPFNYDTYVPPKLDGSTPPGDGGGDGSAPPSDGGGTCPGPSGASCSGCPSTHLCTAAKGGTCAKTVVLSGPASGKAVLKAVALAYVECWGKKPSKDTLCSTFDTCNMTGMLNDQMVKTWVCNSAQVSDFPSSAVFDEVKGIVSCSFYQTYRPKWQVTSVTGGKKADICMSFDVDGWLYYDYLNVDACSKYPPK
jgi:hypothetical protein